MNTEQTSKNIFMYIILGLVKRNEVSENLCVFHIFQPNCLLKMLEILFLLSFQSRK